MILVDDIRCETHDGRSELRAAIHVAGKVHDTWFRWQGRPPPAPADAFLALCLRPAMNMGHRLRIRGTVSAQMLANAREIQSLWKGWHPQLDWLEIEVDGTHAGPSTEHADAPGPARGTAAFFSGGVDSFHTALRDREQIATLVFAPFFDNHRFTPALEEQLLGAVTAVADGLGKELLIIETNARQFLDRYDEWLWVYGGVLAAFGHALSGHVATQFIPSSAPENVRSKDGSSPAMDPLWSSEWVRFEHVGADCTRFGKVAAIADEPLARRHLRVCWSQQEYNCCQCPKCLRTMTSLSLLGKLADFPGFAKPLDIGRIAAGSAPTKAKRWFIDENLQAAQKLGGDAELIAALQKARSNKHDRRLGMRLHAVRKALQRRYRGWLKWRYGR